MDADRIKKAQSRGWVVIRATKDAMYLRCPSHGCGLKCKVTEGKDIPAVDPDMRRNRMDIPIGSFDDIRLACKDRREELCLTISDIEHGAGLAHGHIGKAEKENPDRTPQISTVLLWLQTLGYEMVLRPTDLPPLTSRLISTSRQMEEVRSKRNRNRRLRPSRQ